ncbi:ABC transporter ATP-binding protein [Spirillospora sp. NPDC048911]|uniref:ABC transporter ATP-binding protein n=1 Tax=Spirillospora sp. NPDC048911 TaxID=3364527 RepID=UPI00371F129D
MTSAEQPPPIIEIDHVDKQYRSRRAEAVHALKDVSLSIRDGEFVSIVGPSGCGKSTLLKIVNGLEHHTGGVLRFHTDSEDPRQAMGMVFQQPLLLPWRTILDNVLLPRDLRGRAGRGADVERAKTLLRTLRLGDFMDRHPKELSGGMQQRVGIARALMHDPPILLMDEPFGALDAMTRDQMSLELLQIWERDRKTVLFVTHSISEAVLLSDRVVVMSSRPGRIVSVVDVGLPRPRRLSDINTEQFGAYVKEIRTTLDSQHELATT